MEVSVVVAAFIRAGGFTGKARRIIVINLAILPIEEVEGFGREGPILVKTITNLRAQQNGFSGTHAVIFKERTRTKVAHAQAAKKSPLARLLKGDAGSEDAFNRSGDVIARGIIVAKLGVRNGKVRIQREPWLGRIIVSELDAVTATGTACFRCARVANKQQFAINIQPPKRYGALQTGHGGGAHAHFRPVGSNQRISSVTRCSHTAAIVAVKSQATADVNVRLRPGSKNKTALGAHDEIVFSAGVGRVVSVHVEMEIVCPQSEHRTELFGPLDLVLDIRRHARFPHIVRARDGGNAAARLIGLVRPTTRDGLEKTVLNAVASDL